MPYTREWDEASPPGTAPANTLDTIIQHLKTDMRERLSQVVRGWSDDDVDPKGIKFQTGNAASRPSADLEVGFAYFASDISELSIWDGTEWIVILGGTGGGGGGGGGGGTPGPTSTVYNFTQTIASLPSASAPAVAGPYVWTLADNVARGKKLKEIRYRMRKSTESFANYWGVFPGSHALSPDEAGTGNLYLFLEQLNIDPAGVPFALDAEWVDWVGIFYFFNNVSTLSVVVEVILELWD